MVSFIDSYWLQHPMNVLIGLFRQYGLAANAAKSHTMTCQPGTIMLMISEEAREHNCMGVGASYCEIIWKLIH